MAVVVALKVEPNLATILVEAVVEELAGPEQVQIHIRQMVALRKAQVLLVALLLV
jgi:hypothetical protein